ncbi:hypothetical protein TNCV_2040541 [Trichonephila clavipes]|nr:hypothetical protein TNCV_2040541 [Trichonephila clavipes]
MGPEGRKLSIAGVKGLMHVKSVEAQSLFVGVVWKFGEDGASLGVVLVTLRSSPPDHATVYQLLQRSINRQVDNRVAKNDANLAVSLTFRYVSIISLL